MCNTRMVHIGKYTMCVTHIQTTAFQMIKMIKDEVYAYGKLFNKLAINHSINYSTRGP